MTKIMQKKRVRTQNAIIKAATYLFRKQGFEGTSMESIAERAEIAAGTLYNYYGSKPILLIAIFGDLTQNLTAIAPKRSEGEMTRDVALADVTSILQIVTRATILFPKAIMRQIFAQLFVLDAHLVAELVAMDMQIVAMLLPILGDMQAAGMLTIDADIEAAALLLFGSAMIQHQTYISLEEMSEEQLNDGIAAQTKMILFGLLRR
ncbi:MAG: TetR/AcrR family transcriptional regulator [Alphaproteobacteria bacterium]|nr:TetR/AcrR family transcriptional regulator [Alphaproteobacteria bacterium]